MRILDSILERLKAQNRKNNSGIDENKMAMLGFSS